MLTRDPSTKVNYCPTDISDQSKSSSKPKAISKTALPPKSSSTQAYELGYIGAQFGREA